MLDKHHNDTVDDTWYLLVLALIGEQLNDNLKALGVVVSIKPYKTRVSVWTRDAHDSRLQKQIGCRLRECACLSDQGNIQLQYRPNPGHNSKLTESHQTYTA